MSSAVDRVKDFCQEALAVYGVAASGVSDRDLAAVEATLARHGLPTLDQVLAVGARGALLLVAVQLNDDNDG